AGRGLAAGKKQPVLRATKPADACDSDPPWPQREVAGNADPTVAVGVLPGSPGVGSQAHRGQAAVPEGGRVGFLVDTHDVRQEGIACPECAQQQHSRAAVDVPLALRRDAGTRNPAQRRARTDSKLEWKFGPAPEPQTVEPRFLGPV